MTSAFKIEIILTNEGKLDDFKFRTEKVTKTTVLWRCVKKGCDDMCKTDLEDKITLDGKLDHNHGPDDERKF